jgi:hypothetical protein
MDGSVRVGRGLLTLVLLTMTITSSCELLSRPSAGGGLATPRPTAMVGTALPTSEGDRVTGVVLSVVGTSPISIDGFTLRTNDGLMLTFEMGQLQLDGEAFDAGHLREHQASAEPVAVEYLIQGDRRLAVRLTDAP